MPAGITTWTSSKLAAIAVVWISVDDELVPIPLAISSYQLSGGVNEIPMLSMTVAVGREVNTGFPSNIHYLADFMQMQLPVQLYAMGRETDNSYGIPVEPWPTVPFLNFEGYTTGVGFSKNRAGSAGYTITAQNWLTDLNSSSSLSRSTATLTPGQLSSAAAFFGGNGLDASFASQTMAADFFATDRVSLDFWGNSLAPWLEQLCNQDLLTDPDDPILEEGGSNVEALRALQRFEPYPPQFEGDTGYRFGVPLVMDAGDILEANEAITAIVDDICQETFDSMASTTLWDKLVNQFAANYQFAVVPLVQSALVVPMCPGLRSIWQVIYPEEYDSISMSGETPRAMRGMRLFAGVGSQTGAFGMQQGETADNETIGGRYDNPNMDSGMIRFRNGPRWLSAMAAPAAYAADAAAPNGVVGNAFFPGAGAVPVAVGPGIIQQRGESLFNLFAHALYLTEVTKGRSGTISGRLRFDIAPGSSVAIVVSEEKFVKGYTGRPNSIVYGTVRRVTHVVNAESKQASTLFDIGWLRSETENLLDGTSADGHPVWSEQWAGAPFVELPEFIPNPENPWNFGS